MSRKSKSFSQLYDYFTREKWGHCFSRNTYANCMNKKEFVSEFYANAKYLKNARGKLYMYHEVLSLGDNDLSIDRQKEILLDIAEKYLILRAEHHLSLGVLHEDKHNLHIHLMISANEIESDRRVRLSKKDFSSIQKTLENYKNQKYHELKQTSFYQGLKDLSRDKQGEQEIKNRGAKSIKDQIKEDLQETFRKANTQTYFENHLSSQGFEVYTRGQSSGVRYKGKNYRLKTLGLENDYKQMMKRFEKKRAREFRREKKREERSR